MATTITDTLTAAQDQVLDAIERIQEPAVDAVRTVVETIDGFLPEDRPIVPFADVFPHPKQLVELSYSFAQKVLDNQHEFAKALVDAWSPLLPEAPKAAKPTVAKKAAA
jgi:hypothetical protein